MTSNETHQLRPEMDLLLQCIRPEIDQETRERIRAISHARIDWHCFLELAQWHTLAPFLHAVRARLALPCPHEVSEELRNAYISNTIKNLSLTAELAKLLRQFEEAEIPVIALKGPMLAAYYGSAGAREFQDLDLLIQKTDLSRADRLLEQNAFHASEDRLAFARAFDFELTYEREGPSVSVDLHWSLLPSFLSRADKEKDVWDRAVTTQLAGRGARVLRAEDSVLFLCAHGTKHIWESLGWVCDVALVLSAHPELVWEELFCRARELRRLRALSLGLLLTGELLGAKIPAPYWSQVSNNREVEHLAGLVYRQLFEDRTSHWTGIASSRFLMSSRDNFRDAFRLGADRIFRPTKAEWRAVRLSPKLFPLYYPVRLFRLLTKHSQAS